jgi:hypothetical protein
MTKSVTYILLITVLTFVTSTVVFLNASNNSGAVIDAFSMNSVKVGDMSNK